MEVKENEVCRNHVLNLLIRRAVSRTEVCVARNTSVTGLRSIYYTKEIPLVGQLHLLPCCSRNFDVLSQMTLDGGHREGQSNRCVF